MVEIKEMPYDEKYSSMLSYMKLLDDNVLPLVEKELGAQKAELRTIWQKGTQTILEDVTYEEKFDIAYGNWVRKYASAFKSSEKLLVSSDKGSLVKSGTLFSSIIFSSIIYRYLLNFSSGEDGEEYEIQVSQRRMGESFQG